MEKQTFFFFPSLPGADFIASASSLDPNAVNAFRWSKGSLLLLYPTLLACATRTYLEELDRGCNCVWPRGVLCAFLERVRSVKEQERGRESASQTTS